MPNKHSGFYKKYNSSLSASIADLYESNSDNISYCFNMLDSCSDDLYKKYIIEDLAKYLATDYLISLYFETLRNL